MHTDTTYLNLVQHILTYGKKRDDRTGVGTIGIFDSSMVFDLTEGFPLLTTKKLNFKAILVELLWFLQGSTNIEFLHKHNVHIWDEWADQEGNLGPVYGKQWRSWPASDGAGSIDQIANLINGLKNNPFSRRHLVSAWNPAEIESMALPPCHALFQFYVEELSDFQRIKAARNEGIDLPELNALEYLDSLGYKKYGLRCKLYQRSADIALGVPYNIASYALLTMMVAQQVDMVPLSFHWTGGDIHIYSNHVEGLQHQVLRHLKQSPTVRIQKAKDIFSYTVDDFELNGYEPHPFIKFDIAV